MAKVIDGDLVQKARGKGRESVYPWDKWLDGQQWELMKGEDFKSKTAEHFRQATWQAAKKRGIKVRTSVIDNVTIRIQAVTK